MRMVLFKICGKLLLPCGIRSASLSFPFQRHSKFASVVTAYDIFLTFSREVDCIWKRKFSAVTLLFAVNRYAALGQAIVELISDTYVPSALLASTSP